MTTEATAGLRQQLLSMLAMDVQEVWTPCLFVHPLTGVAMAKVWRVFFELDEWADSRNRLKTLDDGSLVWKLAYDLGGDPEGSQPRMARLEEHWFALRWTAVINERNAKEREVWDALWWKGDASFLDCSDTETSFNREGEFASGDDAYNAGWPLLMEPIEADVRNFVANADLWEPIAEASRRAELVTASLHLPPSELTDGG